MLHALLPTQSPPQLLKVETVLGVAYRTTFVPEGNDLSGQNSPELHTTSPFIDPPPVPEKFTRNIFDVWFVKVAVTDWSPFAVRTHVEVPLHAPPHPEKV